jgi:hypothetical protein
MNGLYEAAREFTEFMTARGWRFCLIGGMAVQRWGEPRTTLDVDFTLLTGWGDEAPFIDALLGRFASRVPEGRKFALENRVLLLRADSGKSVDIALGALPFEEEMVRRAESLEFAPGLSIPCCTAEDLFIMKAFAGRARDWLDAESILARQSGLDRSYILQKLVELGDMKDNHEALERTRTLFEARS